MTQDTLTKDIEVSREGAVMSAALQKANDLAVTLRWNGAAAQASEPHALKLMSVMSYGKTQTQTPHNDVGAASATPARLAIRALLNCYATSRPLWIHSRRPG